MKANLNWSIHTVPSADGKAPSIVKMAYTRLDNGVDMVASLVKIPENPGKTAYQINLCKNGESLFTFCEFFKGDIPEEPEVEISDDCMSARYI